MSNFFDNTLFGVDLRALRLRLDLGIRQLLFDDESLIMKKFSPPIREIGHSHGANSAASCELEPESIDQALPQPECWAWHVSEEDTLIRELELPNQAEIYVVDAVASEVSASSPFGDTNTCFGYQIVNRGRHHLKLRIALMSRHAAEANLRVAQEALGASRHEIELWASGERNPIVISGFGEGHRHRLYLKAIQRAVVRAASLVFAVCAVATLPAFWMAITATQLQELQDETQLRVASVVETRGQLVRAQQLIATASHWHAGHQNYLRWLHKVAEITPDSVYLTRLGITENNRLTVTGFAENAADYQGILAATGWFSDLSAPSAFSRDAREQRDRFTLTMTLDQAP